MKIKRKYPEMVSYSTLIPAPTPRILNLRNSLNWKLALFRKDTFNEQEDDLTDDEVIKEIKIRKLHEQISRTDTLTDLTAID